MYLHFLCSFSQARNTVCVHGIKDVQKKDYSKFSYNDQPLLLHSETVIRRIRQLGVRRTKNVMVELKGPELAMYFDGQRFNFKGKPMQNAEDLITEMATRSANKEIGILKRKETIRKKKAEAMSGPTELDQLKLIQAEISKKKEELISKYKNETSLQFNLQNISRSSNLTPQEN